MAKATAGDVCGRTIDRRPRVPRQLLQESSGPKAREQLIERFPALAFLQPDRFDCGVVRPDRYTVDAQIGAGDMASVYRVREL